jgi:AraC family transcriptional regulator
MLTQARAQVRNYDAASSMPGHQHDEPGVSLVVYGRFVERIGGRERDYARGDVAFLPAGVTHAQAYGAGGVRQVIFQPQADWIDYLADCKVALEDAPHVRSPAFAQLGDRLQQELRRDDAFSQVACEGMILELVAAFGRACDAEHGAARPPAWLRAARDFIHVHALEPVSLAQIARAAGRHEIHLAREFRRYYAISVGGYLRRLRIELAAQLLLQPDLALSEIALACGLSSHAHLCREFKARLGATPSEYRAERLVGVDLDQLVEEVAAFIDGGHADPLVEAVDAAEVGLVEVAADP